MELSHQDLDDLIRAVRLWLDEGGVTRSSAEWERVRGLLTRLKVRRITTQEISR